MFVVINVRVTQCDMSLDDVFLVVSSCSLKEFYGTEEYDLLGFEYTENI